MIFISGVGNDFIRGWELFGVGNYSGLEFGVGNDFIRGSSKVTYLRRLDPYTVD